MKSVRSYEGERLNAGQSRSVLDDLVVEHPLRIVINEEPITITMQTPGDEYDLVRGLLYSEDIYRDRTLHPALELITGNVGLIDEVRLQAPAHLLRDGFMNARQLLSVASCGICGRTTFEGRKGQLERSPKHEAEKINEMFQKMRAAQNVFALTGGCHSAAAFTHEGMLLSCREDIGRHNAVDKVIGDLLRQERISEAHVLLVSGRVSYEIVSKAFMAGIPTLAAVSAPSSLAVDFAKELGLTLLGFCREERMTLYS